MFEAEVLIKMVNLSWSLLADVLSSGFKCPKKWKVVMGISRRRQNWRDMSVD